MNDDCDVCVGDVVLFRGNDSSVYTKAIKLYNWLAYPVFPEKAKSLTHAGVVVDVTEGMVVVGEARASKEFALYRYDLNEIFNSDLFVVMRPETGEECCDDICVKEMVGAFEGGVYDWFSVAALIVPFTSVNSEARRLFCSEAVARVLKQCFGVGFDGVERVTPAELFVKKELRRVD